MVNIIIIYFVYVIKHKHHAHRTIAMILYIMDNVTFSLQS